MIRYEEQYQSLNRHARHTTKDRISLACEVAHGAGDVADLSFQMGRLDNIGLRIFANTVENLELATAGANCWDWGFAPTN